MQVVQPRPHDLAYLDDIPGSRCGPEDGPWPRSYELLDEGEIWRELTMLARPHSTQLERGVRVDSINFQPCPGTRTQDRYVVHQLDIHGHPWTLTGVFDGHLGEATVEHVAHHLPIIITEFLQEAFKANPAQVVNPNFVAELLTRSIVSFDDAIAGDVLDLFPGGLEGVTELSNSEIRQIINDQHKGGANFNKARLCMYGTTAIVALVDPGKDNLWVANLGDCQAIMVSPDEIDEWKAELLTVNHNGGNEEEIHRVMREHPGEKEAVIDGRVLGALAPFRCLGDVPFKQPPKFTRRILYNIFPGLHDTSPWEEFLVRNLTPPYISSKPEITHRRLKPSHSTQSHSMPGFLILCSDGFTDLCSSQGQLRIITNWARKLGIASPVIPTIGTRDKSSNLALRLLREALGGEDRFSVSRVLTLDMDVAWIDDTAIIVMGF